MRYPPSLVSISLPPSHTHHTVLLTISPPHRLSIDDSQNQFGKTALAYAIEYSVPGCSGYEAGAAECATLLRAAGAQ